MLEKIKYAFLAVLENEATNIFITIHPRDKSVVVFGAWMGKRFADNSRYLFQYLSDNKKALNLSHVVWVTRDKNAYREIKKLNYEVCMAGTSTARRWQLKAGTHIICNNAGYGSYPPDIDVKYSWGARKIQLWHGVGFKAVGSSSNNTKNHENYRRFINKHRRLKSWISSGGWSECNILSTSTFDKDIMIKSQNSFIDRVFISSYPRYCDCLQLTDKEKNIIDKVDQYEFVLIYLPTFRDNYDHYTHPLEDSKVQNYLIEHDVLWIEKQHSVSNYNENDFIRLNNVMLLDPDFDVNILYNHVNVIISDYSSTVCDGIYKKKETIMYTPDLLDFQNGSGGLLLDVKNYFGSIISMNIEELLSIITECREHHYWNSERTALFKRARELFFNNSTSSYEAIWKDIENLRK